MKLQDKLKYIVDHHGSIRSASKKSGIAYMTLYDIFVGRSNDDAVRMSTYKAVTDEYIRVKRGSND